MWKTNLTKQAELPANKGGATAVPANVVNLMDALRKSIAAEKKPAKASPAKRSSPAKKRA